MLRIHHIKVLYFYDRHLGSKIKIILCTLTLVVVLKSTILFELLLF